MAKITEKFTNQWTVSPTLSQIQSEQEWGQTDHQSHQMQQLKRWQDREKHHVRQMLRKVRQDRRNVYLNSSKIQLFYYYKSEDTLYF